MSRGFFGVAVYRPKNEINIGTLWRTANLMGASFIATIGHRYRAQSSDTLHSPDHVPLFHYQRFEDFRNNMPYNTSLVAVELTPESKGLKNFVHPERAIYLLGAEDNGIPPEVLDRCRFAIKIETERSLNVAVAGSIVLYDRSTKTHFQERVIA